jgi:YbgC/YbaW family acyl-CoA thioester hydrolase
MFYDTDCAAVVHNIAYLRHIETARTILAEQLGWKIADMGSNGEYPVVVRTEIDYRRPARLGDELIINGWLDSVETARFWCGFTIIRKSDDLLLVTCRQMLAVVKMPEGRVLRLPVDWKTRWELGKV